MAKSRMVHGWVPSWPSGLKVPVKGSSEPWPTAPPPAIPFQRPPQLDPTERPLVAPPRAGKRRVPSTPLDELLERARKELARLALLHAQARIRRLHEAEARIARLWPHRHGRCAAQVRAAIRFELALLKG